MRMKSVQFLVLTGLLFVITQCTVQYSMGGANIQPDVKTITVQDFPNRAPSGPANMGQFFTNELKDKFLSQTNLTFVNDRGDLTFSGGITEFETRPVSVGGDQTANQTRLTIRVHVKFTNRKYPENSFETDFSQYEDFNATQSLSEVETQLVQNISEKLIDDIFRRAVVNW